MLEWWKHYWCSTCCNNMSHISIIAGNCTRDRLKKGQTGLLMHPDYVIFKGLDAFIDKKHMQLGLTWSAHTPPFYPRNSLQPQENTASDETLIVITKECKNNSNTNNTCKDINHQHNNSMHDNYQ